MAGPVTAVGGTDESTEALLSSSSLDSMAIDQAAASDASLPMSHQQNSHPLKDHACRHHSHQPPKRHPKRPSIAYLKKVCLCPSATMLALLLPLSPALPVYAYAHAHACPPSLTPLPLGPGRIS